MNPRTEAILEAAIRRYIETGSPVSSRQLAATRGFGVRAATIRNELNALTSEGFLAQPHTSGGRVPTDKGYRFIVARLLQERAAAPPLARRASEAGTLTRDLSQRRFSAFVDELADDFSLLGVGYGVTRRVVYKRGLDELFDQIAAFGDVESLGELAAIAADFEALDERMASLSARLTGAQPAVFIGRSPITASRHLSVVANCFNCGGEPFIAAVIGPKRMHYDDVIGLFEEVRRAMGE